MTTVFVYEYCCAVGLGRDASDPAHSLYREGRAMRDAVSDDFRRLSGAEVVTLDAGPDANAHPLGITPTFWAGLQQRSALVLGVAPETDGELERLAVLIEGTCRPRLGCSIEAIQLASDKLALNSHWTLHGVPAPPTALRVAWPWDRLPAVIKPRDGAGSVGTCVVMVAADWTEQVIRTNDEQPGNFIAQDYVPGRPASVAFLVGPRESVPLIPTFQILSDDGRFRYLGGELPIRPDLAERAVSLGRRAIDCVPGLRGYVGVDVILGDAADGSRDYAIEINPRLTTSYIGLRHLADFNLAGAMLAVATGEPVGELRWKPERVRFHPNGRVESNPTPGTTP